MIYFPSHASPREPAAVVKSLYCVQSLTHVESDDSSQQAGPQSLQTVYLNYVTFIELRCSHIGGASLM